MHGTTERPSILRAAWNNPWLLLALTALIWAGHSLVGRLAVGQIAPMTLTLLRWIFALGPILFTARRNIREDFAAMRPRWLFVGAMGALGYTAFNAIFYFAAHHTSALNISIIQGAVPALVLIGASVVFGERASALQMLGAVLTMAGVVVIASQGDPRQLASIGLNLGDLLMLVASVLYAGYTVGLRARPAVSGLGFLAAMAIAAMLTSIPLFVIEVAHGDFIWPTAKGYMLLIYAALGPAFIAQLFYLRGVQLIGPGRAGVFVNLVPVFGAIMAVALLGEPFAGFQVLALALVVGGIVVAQRKSF